MFRSIVRRLGLAAAIFIGSTLMVQAASVDDLAFCAGTPDTWGVSDVTICTADDCQSFERPDDPESMDYSPAAWLSGLVGQFWLLMSDDDPSVDKGWMEDSETNVSIRDGHCTVPGLVRYSTNWFKDKETGDYAYFVDARCAFFGVDPRSDLYDNNVSSAAYLVWPTMERASIYQFSDCPFLADGVLRDFAKVQIDEEFSDFEPVEGAKRLEVIAADQVDNSQYEYVGQSVEVFDPFAITIEH